MADMDDMFGDDIVPAENATEETQPEPMETTAEEGTLEQNGTTEHDTENTEENGVKVEPIVIEDEKVQDGGVIEDAEEEKKEEKKPEIVPYVSDTDTVQVRLRDAFALKHVNMLHTWKWHKPWHIHVLH